jgi:hypothetical protein
MEFDEDQPRTAEFGGAGLGSMTAAAACTEQGGDSSQSRRPDGGALTRYGTTTWRQERVRSIGRKRRVTRFDQPDG